MKQIRFLLRSDAARDLLTIFGFAAALRLLLLFLFPVPYGHDGFGRLFFKDQVLLGHWLPLTQFIVWVCFKLLDNPFLVRLVFAVVTACGGWGFYLFLRLVTNRFLALTGGLVFSSNALFLFLSLMPYQDVLFLGLLFGSLALLFGEQGLRSRVGSLLFGLACLTRYESWFILPVLFYLKLRASPALRHWSSTPLLLGRTALFLGWAPLLWLVLNRVYRGSFSAFLFQTEDSRLYAWNPHLDIAWLAHYAGQMLYWIGLFGSPLVFLAPLGVWLLFHRQEGSHPAVRVLGVFGGLVLGFYFFIMDQDQETVFRFVLIPLALVLPLAILGVQPLLTVLDQRGVTRKQALAALLAFLCLHSSIPILRVTRSTEYRDPFLIAGQLNSRLRPGEKALIIARRLSPTDAGPLSYQRIAVQSGAHRILSSGLVEEDDPVELLNWARREGIRYVVRFHDPDPMVFADLFFLEMARPREGFVEVVYDTATASLLEIRGWPEAREISEEGR